MNFIKNPNDDPKMFSLTHPWKITVTAFSDDLSCINLFVDYNNGKIVCPACSTIATIVNKKVYAVHIPEIIFGLSAKLTAYIPILGQHNKKCKADSEPQAISNTFLLDIIIKVMGDSHGNNPFLYLFNAVAGRWEKPRFGRATIPAGYKSF